MAKTFEKIKLKIFRNADPPFGTAKPTNVKATDPDGYDGYLDDLTITKGTATKASRPSVLPSISKTTTASTSTTTSRSKPGLVTSTIDFASVTRVPGSESPGGPAVRELERIDNEWVGIYEYNAFGRRLLRKIKDPLLTAERDKALERMDREKKVRERIEKAKNSRRDMEF